jgi:hypothetical protein
MLKKLQGTVVKVSMNAISSLPHVPACSLPQATSSPMVETMKKLKDTAVKIILSETSSRAIVLCCVVFATIFCIGKGAIELRPRLLLMYVTNTQSVVDASLHLWVCTPFPPTSQFLRNRNKQVMTPLLFLFFVCYISGRCSRRANLVRKVGCFNIRFPHHDLLFNAASFNFSMA